MGLEKKLTKDSDKNEDVLSVDLKLEISEAESCLRMCVGKSNGAGQDGCCGLRGQRS